MNIEEQKENWKFKACPFKKGFSCANCELLMPGVDMCVFKCINANLGLIAKSMNAELKKKIK